MTQEQIPLAALLAACFGVLAGFFALRSWPAALWSLLAAVAISILGCVAYGYGVTIRAGGSFTFVQILAGFALALPGLIIFVGMPAGAGWGASALMCRMLRRRTRPEQV